MIYNIHYDVCAAIIACVSIAFLLAKKALRQTPNKILLLIFITGALASAFDIISAYSNSYVDDWSFAARDFHNYAYLLLNNAMSFFFFMYTVELTEMLFGSPNEKKIKILFSLPFLLDIVLCFLNHFTGLIFYYDEHKIYRHGYGFYALYAIAF